MRKTTLITLLLAFLCCGAFAQTGGLSTRNTSDQVGYTAIYKRYGTAEYNYTFNVHNGSVTWKFTSSVGNGSGQFRCNRSISGETIASECAGVAYWNFACMFIWDMVEKHNKFDSLSFKWALEALESALKQLEKGKATSPGAYNRVNLTYTDIQKAEKGEAQMSLWDTLCFYSTAMAENALNVSDLYDYDF